jgi:hypothetical protein
MEVKSETSGSGSGRRRKWTIAEMRTLAEAKGGRCLSEEFVESTTPLWFECERGHRWQARPRAIRGGHWCVQCHHDRMRGTLKTMQDLAADRGGRCLSDSYLNGKQPLRWQCAEGHEWEAAARRVLEGHWCPWCQRVRMRLGIERMHALAARRGGRCLSEDYASLQTKLVWQCSLGHTWSTTPATIIRGHWCPYCVRRGRPKIEDLHALAHSLGGAVSFRKVC